MVMEPSGDTKPLEIDAELELDVARILLIRLDHRGPGDHPFCSEGAYWIDLCLTPRRPNASARFVDVWGPHRFTDIGSVIAFPPGRQMLLRSSGGRHASVICVLRKEAVEKWFPDDFEWTDRRLEACLHITNDKIRWLLLKLNQELRHPGIAMTEVCEAVVGQLAIELARHLIAVNEPTEKGGLASWRLRVIDERLEDQGDPPTLTELAELCKMSVRQLTRGFRTSRGCSISDHLAQVRIDAAKRRLSTDETIKTIARSLGYATQSSFTFAFRRATGATPNEYRKQAGRARQLTDKRRTQPRSP